MPGFLHRQIGDQCAVNAGVRHPRGEGFEPHAQHRVEVGEDDDADRGVAANLLGQREHLLEGGALAQRPFAGALNHRAVGQRIAERHAEFDDGCSRVDRGQHDVARGGEIRIAAGEVGDQGGFSLKRKRHENGWMDES